jgi:hypothetical protein
MSEWMVHEQITPFQWACEHPEQRWDPLLTRAHHKCRACMIAAQAAATTWIGDAPARFTRSDLTGMDFASFDELVRRALAGELE